MRKCVNDMRRRVKRRRRGGAKEDKKSDIKTENEV